MCKARHLARIVRYPATPICLYVLQTMSVGRQNSLALAHLSSRSACAALRCISALGLALHPPGEELNMDHRDHPISVPRWISNREPGARD